MFCPKCKYEYKQGVTECFDCNVPLVSELPLEPNREFIDLVTVYTTANQANVMIAKTILEDVGIKYFMKNDSLQDLFGFGRIGFNPLIGAVEVKVAPDDIEEARQLLEDLNEN